MKLGGMFIHINFTAFFGAKRRESRRTSLSRRTAARIEVDVAWSSIKTICHSVGPSAAVTY